MRVITFAFLFSCLFCVSGHSEGVFKSGRHRSASGMLSYRLFVPSGVPKSSRIPLLVMLHGCRQTPNTFAAGTEMNQLAEEKKLFVLYPAQSNLKNPLRCWNWQNGKNQTRKGGEAALISELISEIVGNNERVDEKRIYVAGISAGGAMAAILSVCFPEVFQGAAIHSGVGFGFARGTNQALLAMKEGNQLGNGESLKQAQECSKAPSHVPTLILHGTEDPVVSIKNAHDIRAQRLKLFGLSPADQLSRRVFKGDPHTLPFVRDTYGKTRSQPAVELVVVEGLEHAWSGGDAQQAYVSEMGPSSTSLIWGFFSRIP